MKTILFQGDSITDALRVKTAPLKLPGTETGIGYALFVNAELGAAYPGEYQVINKGIWGSRVTDLYTRVKADIINLKPDVLSILIGVNDVWHEFNFGDGVNPEKYFKIYSMLIEEVKEALPDIRIILMEPFVLKGTETEERWAEFQAEVKKTAAMAKKVADKYDLEFVPLQDKFDELSKAAPNEYWLRDGIHPTAAGHQILKTAWLKQFME